MRIPLAVIAASLMAALAPAQASSETREQYLDRLRAVCEADCLQPKQFQRAARKRAKSDDSDMALIMDVAYLRREGSKIELYNLNLERSILEERAILESAGINTSSRSGVGGLPRGRGPVADPNVIVIEMDQQSVFDLLNPPDTARNTASASAPPIGEQGEIVVEEQLGQDLNKPTLAALRAALLNRRIVVRGKPRLEVGIVGARRDFRRKQVILELGNADDLVMLPRYDEEGNPILDGQLAGLKQTSAAQGE
ncbi:hypothetical protein [Erythrobacter sp. MTPC3]|uniref:hypothetical protein n=1 Tax=Erythrobacter sp. MTPC3 TaxID=3056564 RepID=UPI0036F317F8